MKFIKLLVIVSFLSVFNCYSQNAQILKTIDNQIWMPFTKAFETLNSDLFASIHDDDLIRVNGDGKRVQGKETYIAGYKERWANTARNQTISFRFIERLHSENSASERGIYKLTIRPNTEQEQNYYGKFHVFLRKKNGIWKIVIDYDSSEENTINNSSYESAFDMNDYDKY